MIVPPKILPAYTYFSRRGMDGKTEANPPINLMTTFHEVEIMYAFKKSSINISLSSCYGPQCVLNSGIKDLGFKKERRGDKKKIFRHTKTVRMFWVFVTCRAIYTKKTLVT